MTRKQERRRRVGLWLTVIAGGAALSALAGALLPGVAAGLAAAAVMLAALVAGHRIMIAPEGVAILTYHSVGPAPGWLPWSREISVHPMTFERHLATLRAMSAQVIPTRDFLARRAGGEAISPRAVILHLDDGYRDNHVHAMPALRRHAVPATVFASLDFVEPGEAVRPPDHDQGYMNWPELAQLAHDPLFAVEPHGVDHGRVPVSDRIVDRLTPANWRGHAWLQWAAMPGAKHEWFHAALPQAVPLGAPVPESGLALASCAWRDGTRETPQMLDARIARDLSACVDAFARRLGTVPQVFCWPENVSVPAGRRIAASLGFAATTGGRGRNTAAEPAHVLSRIHMGDRALGFRWLPAEALHLRAAVRLMQGNHYWYLVLAPMNLVRSVVMRLRHRLGHDFA